MSHIMAELAHIHTRRPQRNITYYFKILWGSETGEYGLVDR